MAAATATATTAATAIAAGFVADYIAEGLEEVFPGIIAFFIYQYFVDHMNKGNFILFVKNLVDRINTLTEEIESYNGEIVRVKVSRDIRLNRASSEEQQAFADSLMHSRNRSSSTASFSGATEEHGNELSLTTRRLAERAAYEGGVRAKNSRQRQQEVEEPMVKLEKVMAQAMGVKKQIFQEEARRDFTQACSRALLRLLLRAYEQRNGEKLRKVISDAKTLLERANPSDYSANDFADDCTQLRGWVAVAGEVLKEWDDEKDRHSARVNVTLHSLDSNNRLVMRTLTEEPMGKMFPTSMSMELLNLIKDKKSKQQRDRENRQGLRYSIRPSSAGIAEHDDDFVGLGGLSVPSAPHVSEGMKRDKWEERHRQRITDQMVNRISAATSEGHVASDMGFPVASKR